MGEATGLEDAAAAAEQKRKDEAEGGVAAAPVVAGAGKLMEVSIKLIAPPMYVMTTLTLDNENLGKKDSQSGVKNAGIALLETAIAAVSERITAKG